MPILIAKPRWQHSPANINRNNIDRVSLDTLPDDILTTIAIELAALYPRGPPSAVFVALGATCRSIAFALSLSPHVYNTIFRFQFDISALERRLFTSLVPSIVAPELQRRWRSLKRMRWAASAGPSIWGDLYPLDHIRQDMWIAYVLLLENDGKNWEQLVGWAMLPAYVHAYVDWDLTPACSAHDLPEETEVRSLGLWLLWFLSDNRNPLPEMHRHPQLQRLVTPLAFSSYAYAVAYHPWHSFVPGPLDQDNSLPILPRPLTPRPKYHHFSPSFDSYLSQPLKIRAPLLSEAALHLYFAYTQPPLVNTATPSLAIAALSGLPSHGVSPSSSSKPRCDSMRFDAEWMRLTTRWDTPMPRDLPASTSKARHAYVPGSLTGIFEGIFTLPGLDTYFNVRDGASPIESYQGSIPLSHIQAWKIEEHIHIAPISTAAPSTSSNGPHHVRDPPPATAPILPLRPGPALRAHLPEKFAFDRVQSGIEAMTVSGDSVLYRTWHEGLNDVLSDERATSSECEADSLDGGCREIRSGDESFVEIIVTGEAIEPFQTLRNQSLMEPTSTIRGTIRLRDGLVVLHARPLIPSSGEWIYIGRLDADGNAFTGRWRALQDDPTSHVWEGAFRMQRRTIADL
ncbi:hypothetical protein FRB94_003861 [Tulasnella sp. JGI-2019a]|nr:hypothetical protein FRB94_003861 [Tulasnella sp. JGI-2019a]